MGWKFLVRAMQLFLASFSTFAPTHRVIEDAYDLVGLFGRRKARAAASKRPSPSAVKGTATP